MTLITNPTRAHFADGVLQEALQSELELAESKAPLLIAEDKIMEGDFGDRIHTGLPRATRPHKLTFSHRADLRERVTALMEAGVTPDVIVPFGSAAAIELARKCRYALTQKNRSRPLLFAVPGVDGMPNPCMRNLESWRAGLPSVLIYDPTVALDAGQANSMRALVVSLVRCIESYLAAGFNPPADGMALDGLNRAVKSLPRASESASLDVQREVMAAGLNASFSQEKGIGPASVLAAKLMETGDGYDEAALAQLILRAMVQTQPYDAEKASTLVSVLGREEHSLVGAVDRVLAGAAYPSHLSDFGLATAQLDAAAKGAAGHAGLNFDSARALLETVY